MEKEKFIDLQIHSLYSDGSYTPTQVVKLLKQYNIKVAALADHNTTKGIPEFTAACRENNIKAIPAIEIYVKYKRKNLHLLGYNFDSNNDFLQENLQKICDNKFALLKKITPLLKKKNIIIDPEKLRQGKADYIGMNNLLKHIEANPHNVKQIQKALNYNLYEHWQVIAKYFMKGRETAYPEISIPIKLAIQMITKAGGVPILAHPGQQLRFEEDYLILELKKMGLAGIECFSSHYKYSQVAHYLRLAKRNNLLITGGSDFHGDLEKDLFIQRHWDYALLPYNIYQNIKKF